MAHVEPVTPVAPPVAPHAHGVSFRRDIQQLIAKYRQSENNSLNFSKGDYNFYCELISVDPNSKFGLTVKLGNFTVSEHTDQGFGFTCGTRWRQGKELNLPEFMIYNVDLDIIVQDAYLGDKYRDAAEGYISVFLGFIYDKVPTSATPLYTILKMARSVTTLGVFDRSDSPIIDHIVLNLWEADVRNTHPPPPLYLRMRIIYYCLGYYPPLLEPPEDGTSRDFFLASIFYQCDR